MSSPDVSEKDSPADSAPYAQSTSPESKSTPKVDPQHPPPKKQDKDAPEGGYDDTPIPRGSPGYTVKFTFHRATNVPIADINALSSDPYLLAQLNTDVATRHKEDPPLRFRTPTIHKSTEPTWDEEWIVANVPASGFVLKVRLYDEDPNDADDRLGRVHIYADSLDENWQGIHEEPFKLKYRYASKRAYALRSLAKCFGRTKHIHSSLYVSAEVLGRTKEDGQSGRLYTVGPCRWTRHYSPVLGRLAKIKEPDRDGSPPRGRTSSSAGENKKKIERYNFQANQMQLQGPVPAPLYHRFVEFKPFVKRMFTASGMGGYIMSKALHHQHARVYNFARDTVWGRFPEGPSLEMTKKFLELVHYDQGGRIFTYVLTLDAFMCFTETGKEFGIDMLSKHTMHSDVSIYIAFSGEFFIRRLKHSRKPPPPEPVESSTFGQSKSYDNPTHPPDEASSDDPPTDPEHYELVIDNDSGTYRPNAELLPLLKDFMARSFPDLHVQVLDCQKDAEKMEKMKDQQRERKKSEGDGIIVMQGSRSSSVSSSDDEDFNRFEDTIMSSDRVDERGVLSAAGKEVKRKQQAHWAKAKNAAKIHGKDEEQAEAEATDNLGELQKGT